MTKEKFIIFFGGVIVVFNLALFLFLFNGCTVTAQQGSVCNDTMYVRLCGMPFSQMTDDEYQSYLRMNEDCQAQLRAKKLLKVEGGNGGK